MRREERLDSRGGTVSQQLVGGFFNIDKPAGWTSHDVVAKIRNLLRIKKVGHLGTLDPQVTGVLPICFGKGTKLSALLGNADKSYDAVLRLGQETETEDATGKVVRSTPVPDRLKTEAGKQSIFEVLDSFVGTYLQQPPMYSAVKINGVPLYKVARLGKVVTRASRPVTIRSITSLGIHENDVAFRVTCSKGTYIRTLCADVGHKLGVGGHLLSLRRNRSGIFHLDDAVELGSFSEACKQGHWTKMVYSMETVLKHLPALRVKASQVMGVIHGVQIRFEALEEWDAFKEGTSLRFLDPEGSLLAVGTACCDSSTVSTEQVSSQVPFKIKTVLSSITKVEEEQIF